MQRRPGRWQRPSLDSFVMFLAVVALLGGVVSLISPAVSSVTIATLLPQWLPLWNWCLTFGGVVGAASWFARWPLSALLERLCAAFLGGVLAVYGVAVCVIDDVVFSFASGVIFAAAFFALRRAWQVHREIGLLRRELRILNGGRGE